MTSNEHGWVCAEARAADLAAAQAWVPHPLPAAATGEAWWVLRHRSGQPRALLRGVPALGLALPRVSYHVGLVVHAAAELKLHHRQRTLLLGHDHTGAAELADIGWATDGVPVAEQVAALHALVVHVMGVLRDAACCHMVAELPGVRDATGASPFWQGLGRHFYGGDTARARAEHGLHWRSHVAALLPRQVVYASFLSAEAQAAIGSVAATAEPLRQALAAAGFADSAHINVEDGGPIYEARIG